MDPAQGNNPANNNQPITSDNQQASSSNSQSPDSGTQISKIEGLVNAAGLPPELEQTAKAMVGRLHLVSSQANFFAEYDTISRYITWVASLPWNKPSQDVLDLNHAKQVLDKNHYGLMEVKEQILQYLSIMIMTKQHAGDKAQEIIARAPIISLVGLAGVGKTTIAYSIAEALGRKIERIPFGGMGAAAQLRGKSRFFPDAEPGLVIKALRRAGTSNPVILLDEIDRVSTDARADVMGVLVELLDPTQNKAYVDHFIDYPVDLSQVLFIATSNNTKDVSTAVLDRLEIIQMPSYTDEEKIMIGKTFVLPQVLQESGITVNEFAINDDVWPEAIVRPLGYDPGIRSLQRVLQGMVRKTVYYMLMGKIQPGQKFTVTNENVKQFVSAW